MAAGRKKKNTQGNSKIFKAKKETKTNKNSETKEKSELRVYKKRFIKKKAQR